MLKDLRDQSFVEARGLYKDPVRFRPQFIMNSSNASFEFRAIHTAQLQRCLASSQGDVRKFFRDHDAVKGLKLSGKQLDRLLQEVLARVRGKRVYSAKRSEETSMWRTSHRFRPTFLRTGHLVPLYSWANVPPRAAQRISNRWNDDKDVLRFVFVCQTDLRAIDRLGVVTLCVGSPQLFCFNI